MADHEGDRGLGGRMSGRNELSELCANLRRRFDVELVVDVKNTLSSSSLTLLTVKLERLSISSLFTLVYRVRK